MENSDAYEIFAKKATVYGFKFPNYSDVRRISERKLIESINYNAVTNALFHTLEKYPILIESNLLTYLGYTPFAPNPGTERFKDLFRRIQQQQPFGIKHATLEDAIRECYNVPDEIEIRTIGLESDEPEYKRSKRISTTSILYFLDKNKRNKIINRTLESKSTIRTFGRVKKLR
ncbi:hypothetical protein HYX18_01720 [Candidatus Woesearchaeota archaeon]|nr:hypothetical protein [Candidatus Woesearchaeota archaeon]